MKKIALISCHKDPNYGTMLQAYALHKAIKKLGFNSEYLSYTTTPKGWQRIKYIFTTGIKVPLILLKKILYLIKKQHSINDFSFFTTPDFEQIMSAYASWHKKYIPCTTEVYNHLNITNILQLYDKFIVGSDQTWSPYRNMNYTAFYFNFLQFVNDSEKKCSYAPSFGTSSLLPYFTKRVIKELKTFNYVSCREGGISKVLYKEGNIHIEHVVDPTLLLTPQEWEEVALPITMPSKYILCYILGEKDCISEFAERLGGQTNIPVFYILTRPHYLNKPNLLNMIGPGEFITLIKNATYVCTDSFHGTIFSINFNVPFYSFTKRNTYDKTNDNDRIQEVLSTFNLLDRYKEDYDKNILTPDINFDDANIILNQLRSKSIDFLRELLNA